VGGHPHSQLGLLPMRGARISTTRVGIARLELAIIEQQHKGCSKRDLKFRGSGENAHGYSFIVSRVTSEAREGKGGGAERGFVGNFAV